MLVERMSQFEYEHLRMTDLSHQYGGTVSQFVEHHLYVSWNSMTLMLNNMVVS